MFRNKKIPMGDYPFINCKAGCHTKMIGNNSSFYKWCRLENDDSLTFGEEDRNYAGGESLSVNWLVGTLPNGKIKIFDAKQGCPPPEEMYYDHAIHMLSYLSRYEKEFFDDIMTMLNDNNAIKWIQIINDKVIRKSKRD